MLLLEKERHPRFHIGESLLPMNIPILERLGVLEQVRAIGVLKLGADFPVEGGKYNVFRFDRSLRGSEGYAFHVRRSEFDQLLFEHARREGVDARDGVKVERLVFDAQGRPDTVHGSEGDKLWAVRPRYVIDASGRDAFLGGKLGLKPPQQQAPVGCGVQPLQRRDPTRGRRRRQRHHLAGMRMAGSGSFRCATASPASVRCAHPITSSSVAARPRRS